MGSGEWLEKALLELCGKIETGLDLDADLISGLVSYCERAPPEDAKEYIINIVGQEASQSVVREYLQRRGYVEPSTIPQNVQSSTLQAYIKPPVHEGSSSGNKKQTKLSKQGIVSSTQNTKIQTEASESQSIPKRNLGNPKKKKTGRVISLAEAAKGSIVFKQGKPCSCQARRHKLVSNCLSCGKIVCEQEGEGPCGFCGALVLREGSTYAGLDDDTIVPLSDAEANAEAFTKRLVEYDRNSAARTTVIDDQSDYYEIEGNSWLSKEEKDLLTRKQKEIEDEDEWRRRKVIMTFDLVGRKVVVNEDEASELDSGYRLLRPLEDRDSNRVKPNPATRVQPVFVDACSARNPTKGKQKTRVAEGLCLEISGRVQHDGRELQGINTGFLLKDGGSSDGSSWEGPSVGNNSSHVQGDNFECSLDYN